MPEPSPRCRCCARPAAWSEKRQEFARYCTVGSCTNRERLCRACGASFDVGEEDGGTLYCSAACKPDRHGRGVKECAWCGRACHGGRGRGVYGWPTICQPCLDPIVHLVPRLKAHHVTHERARRLIAEPGCEICGADIVAKTIDTRTGRWRAELVVDHDHRCCPLGAHSCGRCVRGLICVKCNIALGMLQDSASTAVALAKYLVVSPARRSEAVDA